MAFQQGLLAFVDENEENCKAMNVRIDVEEEDHTTRTRVDGGLILRYTGDQEG